MITWRKVASPKNPKGLALGWAIGGQVDGDLVKALPGWAIVLTDQAPTSVTLGDIKTARALVGCSAATKVGLMAWAEGIQSLRSVLIGNLIQPWAVAIFEGPLADVPPESKPWKIKVWADLAERARKGEILFTATATLLTYSKDIKEGGAGRAWPAAWVLGRALGLGDEGLSVGKPVAEGGLYVEVFPAPPFPKDEPEWIAAQDARLNQINLVAPKLLAAQWG